MELKQIKELMTSMGRSGIKKLSIKDAGFEIELERESKENLAGAEIWTENELTSGREYQSIKKIPHELPNSQKISMLHDNAPKEEAGGIYITSPMVGTFYAAPSPEDPPFVKIGDKVEKSSIVCIIEAMKVMNEIKSGHAGSIAEILVESGSPVEFGTKLFRIV